MHAGLAPVKTCVPSWFQLQQSSGDWWSLSCALGMVCPWAVISQQYALLFHDVATRMFAADWGGRTEVHGSGHGIVMQGKQHGQQEHAVAACDLMGLCTHAEGHARDAVVQRRLHLHVCEAPRSNASAKAPLPPGPLDRAIALAPRDAASHCSPLLGL